MQRVPVESSNVASMGYDPVLNIMEVEFKVKTGAGPIYQYRDVPKSVYEDVLNAESIGGALNSLVKGVYSFQRVAAQV